jgi:hypothetical protein
MLLNNFSLLLLPENKVTFKQFRTVLLTSTQMQYLEVSRPVPQLEKIEVGLGMGHILVKLMANMMRQRIRARGSEKPIQLLENNKGCFK